TGEILDVADAGTLQPIKSLRRIGIDVHHAHEVETLAAEQEHARHVGEAELRLAGADLLCRGRRAAPGLEIDVEPGLFVEAHFLGVEVRRVIAACDPVKREGELLRRRLRSAEHSERRDGQFRDDLHTELREWRDIDASLPTRGQCYNCALLANAIGVRQEAMALRRQGWPPAPNTHSLRSLLRFRSLQLRSFPRKRESDERMELPQLAPTTRLSYDAREVVELREAALGRHPQALQRYALAVLSHIGLVAAWY